METNKNGIIIGSVVVVVLIAGVLLFASNRGSGGTTENSATQSANTSATGTTTTTVLSPSTAVTVTANGGGYTVKALPDGASAPVAPNYKAPIVFAASVSAAARTQMQARAAMAEAQITKNPKDIAQWLALGSIYEQAGDYAGAEKTWIYVTEEWPGDYVAFNNLGDLYMNYLKNYPKAEAAYLADIGVAPNDTNAYRALFSLYTLSYKKGTPAAENILKQGIAANPKAADLDVLLARYYKSLGRTADAKAAYDAGVASAQSQGNIALATQIQQEESGQ